MINGKTDGVSNMSVFFHTRIINSILAMGIVMLKWFLCPCLGRTEQISKECLFFFFATRKPTVVVCELELGWWGWEIQEAAQGSGLSQEHSPNTWELYKPWARKHSARRGNHASQLVWFWSILFLCSMSYCHLLWKDFRVLGNAFFFSLGLLNISREGLPQSAHT